MKAAVQVLKQAEDLKSKVSGDILNDNEAWTCHQKLQDLYQQLLVMDLEYALDKKVEQDLWNYVFKNQINALQNQAKDKKNPHRTESQGNLAWFLEVASGFYLQLLQELCDAFDLDLPCRRKGSIYGIIKGSKPVNCKITLPQKSSCLYVCQHCLVHLGDIARYRNQSLQAETFYRHAAQLVPSNGQPYNQLAILEAAKGEKLSTIFYYVRSIGVKHPFPVASTNLQKMFSKIASDDLCIEGKAKLSVYDYINTFLQFHSLIHMTSDLEKASKLLKVLASNLSTLVATESLSSWKLVQMTAINLFAIAHITREPDAFPEKRPENDTLSEEENQVYNLMLELLASMLNGLLLLVYTMKDEQHLKDYYALPVIKLMLDWVKQDVEVLKSQPFSQKLQVWPSLCKLLNGIQQSIVGGFDNKKYQDVPLPEDWDLQCFLPLAKTHKQYKFKETTPRLTEEEENKLRAYRLICQGQWICEQEITGKKLMTLQTSGDNDLLTFEAIIQQSPSSDVLLQLEEVSVSKASRNGHYSAENHFDSCSNSVSSQEAVSSQDIKCEINSNHSEQNMIKDNEKGGKEKTTRSVMKEKSNKIENKFLKNTDEKVKEKKIEKPGIERKENNRPGTFMREKKIRQNVAMQTIMQKKNISTRNEITEDMSIIAKPKLEIKQVTFKTPSPSPPASSEGTPPQTNTPQPPSVNHVDIMTNFPPLQSVYSQVPQLPGESFTSGQVLPKTSYNLQSDNKAGTSVQYPPSNRLAMTFPGPMQNQSSIPESNAVSPSQNYPSSRMMFSSLPATGPAYQHNFNHQSSPQQASEYPVSAYRNHLKDVVALQQAGNFTGNRLNNLHGSMIPTMHQQQFLYSFGPGQPTGPNSPMSPVQQKQNFAFNENPMFGQHIQWFQATPLPNPPSGIPSLQGIKTTNMEQFLTQNQPRPNQVSSPQMEVSPQGSTSLPPAHSQTLSPGTYQIFTGSQPGQQHPPAQQRGPLPENLVFQMQTPPPQIPYNFQSPMTPRLSQHPSSMNPNPSLSKVNADQQLPLTTNKMSASSHFDSEANEVITNTYSLFNSPWSSGLNLSPTTAKEGVSLASSTAPSSGTANFGNFMQAGVQSLWSGPGPSPLERLLEQQKQKRDTAPQ